MTKLILVRHGETEWNVEEIFRGQVDVELNDTGRKQAELLAGYLSEQKIEAVYSSPLKRALNTAKPIALQHKLKVQVNPGINDLDFGKWQGLTVEVVKKKYPGLFAEWATRPDMVKIPDGESLDEVTKRAMALVNEIISSLQDTAVLVTHRVVTKVLVCALLGLDNSHFWNIKQDNCGLTTFVYENSCFVLTEHNNTSFLKPLQKPPLSDF